MMSSNNPDDSGVEHTLQAALAKSGVSTVPPQVQEVTQRHIARLSTLVRQLRAAGVDEAMVRHSTKQLLESYEEELLNVLMDLARDDQA